MNPDDKSFFLDAMEDVQPLKRCADIHWQPSRNTRTREEVDSEQLDNFLTLDFLDVHLYRLRQMEQAHMDSTDALIIATKPICLQN